MDALYAPSGNAPVYRPSGIKNLPSLYFNGSNKFMDVASGFDGTSVTEITIFVVWQPEARSQTNIISRGENGGFQIEDNTGGASYFTRFWCCNGSTTFLSTTGSGNGVVTPVQATVGRADVVSR